MEVVHPGLGSKSVVAKPNSLLLEPRMNVHKNARMTVHGRALLVRRVIEEGWTVASAADAAGCSERTGFKWLARYRAVTPRFTTGRRPRTDRRSARRKRLPTPSWPCAWSG